MFGVDVEGMGDGGRVVFGLAVILPVALSGVFLVAFVPGLWWIFTTYFWVAFPAFGVLARGVAGLAARRDGAAVPAVSKERELLEALRKNPEISPARAAMETSLSVSEADRMLGDLAGEGHLEVRARDGGVFYSLWGARPE